MTASSGENRIDSSDLIVQSLEGYDKRTMQFTHDWNWRKLAGADQLLPRKNSSEKNMIQALLRAIRKTANTDFAFSWGSKKDKLAYDPSCYTFADLCTEQRDGEIMIGEVSGDELINIYNRWVKKNDISVEPPYSPENIVKAKTYSIAIPPSLSWKLKKRLKNLKNTRAGRALKIQDFWKEVLKE